MTRAIYVLLDYQERDGVAEGVGFRTARRTRWRFDLNVARLEAGGDVTVKIQVGPADDNDVLKDVFTFEGGAISAEGTYTQRLPDPDNPTWEISDRDLYVRAAVTAHTLDYYVEVQASAPFFDPSNKDDLDLLDPELRDWQDGRERTIYRAEDDVLVRILDRDRLGVLTARVNDVGFLDAMRNAVAAQANLAYWRKRLLESKEPTQVEEAKRMPELADEAYERLRPFLPEDDDVWRHR